MLHQVEEQSVAGVCYIIELITSKPLWTIYIWRSKEAQLDALCIATLVLVDNIIDLRSFLLGGILCYKTRMSGPRRCHHVVPESGVFM
jgi:hypothetical protein